MGHWLPSATLTKLASLASLTNLTNLANPVNLVNLVNLVNRANLTKNTLATNFLAPCLPFYSKNIPGTNTKQYEWQTSKWSITTKA